MSYFVYYTDDHHEMGGVGLEEFESEQDVEKFITKRMGYVDNPNISNYTVIRGSSCKVEVVKYAEKVKLV